MSYAMNLTGRTFGRLLVIGRHQLPPTAAPRPSRHVLWECLCSHDEFHTICVARADHLISGHTQSCGCLLREWRAAAKK